MRTSRPTPTPTPGCRSTTSDDGGWVVVGGTSEAAPLIAAYYALLGSAAQGPSVGVRERVAAQRSHDRLERHLRGIDLLHLRRRSRLRRPDRRRQHLRRGRDRSARDHRPGNERVLRADRDHRVGPAPGRGVPERRGHHVLVAIRHDHRLRPADPGEDRHRLGHRPGAGLRLAHRPVAGTTYHYRLVAQNSLGTSYGYDYALTTPATTASSPTQSQNPTDHAVPADDDHDEQPAGHRNRRLGEPEHAGRPAAREQAQGRPRGERPRRSSATIAGRGARHHVRAPVRDDRGTRPERLRLAGIARLRRRPRTSAGRSTTCPRARSTTSGSSRPTPGGRPAARVIRFRTSPVTITRVTSRGSQLQLSCSAATAPRRAGSGCRAAPGTA